jgi:REP element-mobilizing transposase RayT
VKQAKNHRCHKREFLLKFSKDRGRWTQWLFEAKKRYKLQVFDFAVTFNHIHLLVVDSDKDVIPNSLQLIAGKTAQEFNKRKKRKGAFWDDRYHATAIESGEHFIALYCLHRFKYGGSCFSGNNSSIMLFNCSSLMASQNVRPPALQRLFKSSTYNMYAFLE